MTTNDTHSEIATRAINMQHLDNARSKLTESREALVRVASTCCMPGRSPAMNESLALLESTVEQLATTPASMSVVNDALAAIEQLGGSVGTLYATCCTPKRATHYTSVFSGLHSAYTELHMALGHGHH